jgi:hypothetical protein
METSWTITIGHLAWPITTLIIALLFRKPVLDLLSRAKSANLSTKGVELVLNTMESKGQITFGARGELSGMTSHDIWALHDLARKPGFNVISKMGVPNKVAARTLIDYGLLYVDDSGKERVVKTTKLGDAVLETAATLL